MVTVKRLLIFCLLAVTTTEKVKDTEGSTTAITSTATLDSTTSSTSTTLDSTTLITTTAPDSTTLVTTTAPDSTTLVTTTAQASTTATLDSTTLVTTTAQDSTTLVTTTAQDSTTLVTTTAQASTTATLDSTTLVTTTPLASTAASTGSTGTGPIGTTSTGTTSATTTTSAPGHCFSSPCSPESICKERFEGFTCICQPGLFYDNKLNSCYQAKTFFSDLTLNKEFKVGMGNTGSEEFKNTSLEIVEQLRVSLNTLDGYLGSAVLKLSAFQRKNGVSADVKNSNMGVLAEVENSFSSKSNTTEEMVITAVNSTVSSNTGILSGANVTYKNLCSTDFCEKISTVCVSKDGQATCNCRSEYVTLSESIRACVACPSGQKAVNSKCEQCPFGLSGFNCNESYLLSVVVVSCVLGVLLISSLVALIVVSNRKSKKTTVDCDEYSMEFHKPGRIPRIPRANPDTSWQPSNLETADSGSTSALVVRGHSEKSEMGNFDGYNDMNNYKSHYPSRSAYGAVGPSNVSRANRNPYYDPDEDTMRRY